MTEQTDQTPEQTDQTPEQAGQTPEQSGQTTHQPAPAVAVLGTGIMGGAMARNLARAGLEVRAWNRTRAKAEPLAADGVRVAATPAAAVRGAGTILTMLYDGPATLAVMRDAAPGLRPGAVWLQSTTAGLDDLPERPHTSDLKGRVVNVFCKCEADPTGRVRDRRNIMLDDSDVHWHRQIKSCVGGVVASVTGDPAVFVSVAAVHQGPSGGGPVIAIVEP